MELIAELAPILLLAAVLGFLMARIGQPPIIGYLLTGIAAGAGMFGFLQQARTITTLGDLGIVLLLFYLGLELSWRKMAPIAGRSFILAIAATGIPFLILLNVFLLAGLPGSIATLAAFALAVTSTALGVQALEVRGRPPERLGRLVVGVNLIIDVFVIAALAALGIGRGEAPNAWILILRIAGFAAACASIGLLVVPRVLDMGHAHPGSRVLLPVMLIALGLGVAYAGHLFGVPLSVGAFLAGSLAAEARCREDLEAYLHPVKELFLAFFFVGVGFQMNLPAVRAVIPWAVGLALLVFLVRYVAVAAVAYLLGEDGDLSLSLAAALLPIGEFSFLLLVAADLLQPTRERLLAMTGISMVILGLLVEPMLRRSPMLQKRLHRRAPGAIRHLLVVVRGAMAPSLSPFPPAGNPVRAAFKDLLASAVVIAGLSVMVSGAARTLERILPPSVNVRMAEGFIGIVLLVPAVVLGWRRWRRLLLAIVGPEKTGPAAERIRLIQRATRGALNAAVTALFVVALFPFLYAMAEGQRVLLVIAAAVVAFGLAFLFRHATARLHNLLEIGMRRGPMKPAPAAPPAAPSPHLPKEGTT